jgi:hypothetical protein
MNAKIEVLLVERDPQVAQLLLLLLGRPDPPTRRFEWTCVEDVESGLRRLARREPFDAVLLGPSLRSAGTRGRLRGHAPAVPILTLAPEGKRRVDPDAVKRSLRGAVARARAALRVEKNGRVIQQP